MHMDHPLLQALYQLSTAPGSRFEFVVHLGGDPLSVTGGPDDFTIELFTKAKRGALGRWLYKHGAYKFNVIVQNPEQQSAQIRVNLHTHDERGHPVRYMSTQKTIDWIARKAVRRKLISAESADRALGRNTRTGKKSFGLRNLRLQYRF